MRIFLDTNVVLRSIAPEQAASNETAEAVDLLLVQKHRLTIPPQVLYEAWAVMTRQENGWALSVSDADALLTNVLQTFDLVDQSDVDLATHWRTFIVNAAVRGTKSHDVRLAAAMTIHGIDIILTRNTPDFRRLDGIRPLHPADVVRSGGLPPSF